MRFGKVSTISYGARNIGNLLGTIAEDVVLAIVYTIMSTATDILKNNQKLFTNNNVIPAS